MEADNQIIKTIQWTKRKTIRQHLQVLWQLSYVSYLHPSNLSQLSCATISKRILKIVVWTILYLAGSYLTITSSYDIIESYLSKPTSLQVTNIINSTEIVVPDSTICVSVGPTTLFSLNTSNLLYSEELNIFFDNTTIDGVFIVDPKAIYAGEVYIIVWKYLAMIYEFESLREGDQNPFQHLHLSKGDDWSALINILVPKILLLKITIEQLKAVFDGKLSNSYRSIGLHGDAESCFIGIWSDEQFTGENPYKTCLFSENITYIGSNLICFSIIRGLTCKTYQNGAVSQPELDIYDDWQGDFFKINPIITIDFSGNYTPPDMTDLSVANGGDTFSFLFNTAPQFTISVMGVLKSMAEVNGQRKCSEEQTLYDCLNNCRAESIEIKCGCSPTTLPMKMIDSDKCNFKQYEACLNFTGDEDNICRAKCLPICERWLYEFTLIVSPGYEYPIFGFAFTSFEYSFFLEVYTWTFEDFIGALGGAMGLWLGLDFVVLIEFFFHPIMKCIRKCLAKPDMAESESSGHEEIEVIENYVLKFKKRIYKYAQTYGKSSKMMAIWVFEQIFWILIYTAGGTCTAYYIFTFLKNYGNISSHVSIMVNQSITLPPATMCILRHADSEFYKIFSSLANPDNDTTPMFYSSRLDVYLNQYISGKESLLSRGNEWPILLRFITFLYLNIMNTAETNDVITNPDSTNQDVNHTYTIQMTYKLHFLYETKNELSADYGTDLVNAMENILEPKLHELNVSMDEIRQKFGYEFGLMFDLQVNFYGSRNVPLSDITTFTFSGYEQFCYQIPLDAVLFEDDFDYVNISVKTTLSTLFSTTSFEGCLLGYCTSPAIFTLDISPHLTEFSNYKYFVSGGQQQQATAHNGEIVHLAISNHFKSIPTQNNGVTSCTFDQTIEVCQAKCRIQLVKQLCNCTPTTWPTLLISNDNECTLSDYKLCLHYNVTEDQSCRNSCPNPCEQFLYIASKINHVDHNVLIINVKNLPYVSVEEEYQYTLGAFLAVLGGMLGLWLGLNVEFLALVIIAPLSFIVGHCIERRMKKADSIFHRVNNSRLNQITKNVYIKEIIRTFNINFLRMDEGIMPTYLIKNFCFAIYYLFSTIATAKLCFDLYLQFRGSPTESSYSIIVNKTIILPSLPTICLPISVNFSDAEINNGFTDILEEIQNNQENYLDDKFNWTDSFMRVILSYLTTYDKYEKFEQQTIVNDSDSYEILPENLQNQIFKLLDDKRYGWNITIDALSQKCGKEFVKLFSLMAFRHDYQKNRTFETFQLDLRTTFMDKKKICYLLPFKEFSSPNDYVDVVMTQSLSFVSEWDNTVTVDLLGRHVSLYDPNLMFDSTLTFNIGENATSLLIIDSILSQLPESNGILKCSAEKSQDECQNDCRTNVIFENCNCTPVNLLSSSTKPYCTLRQHLTTRPFSPNNLTTRPFESTSLCIRAEFQ